VASGGVKHEPRVEEFCFALYIAELMTSTLCCITAIADDSFDILIVMMIFPVIKKLSE
jgi:hypothetical protein